MREARYTVDQLGESRPTANSASSQPVMYAAVRCSAVSGCRGRRWSTATLQLQYNTEPPAVHKGCSEVLVVPFHTTAHRCSVTAPIALKAQHIVDRLTGRQSEGLPPAGLQPIHETDAHTHCCMHDSHTAANQPLASATSYFQWTRL